LSISSITITGALINNTAFHSSQLRGVMANKVCCKTIYQNTTAERSKKKAHGEERNIEDHEMQRHTQSDSSYKIHVPPQGQTKQTFVFRKRIHGVEHLDHDENGERHSRRMVGHFVRKHLATYLRKL